MDTMRMILSILIICMAAGCSSPGPTWPTVPGENSPDQVTVVTNGTKGVSAFRVKQRSYPAPPKELAAATQTNATVDVAASAFQDYDGAMVKAILARWHELRANAATNEVGRAMGKVVVEFRLHADGRISNLKTLSTKVNNSLTYLCERAVADPEPYAPWPEEMIHQIGEESRVVRFTFEYK